VPRSAFRKATGNGDSYNQVPHLVLEDQLPQFIDKKNQIQDILHFMRSDLGLNAGKLVLESCRRQPFWRESNEPHSSLSLIILFLKPKTAKFSSGPRSSLTDFT
jgi:hypothetical protein